MRGLWWTRSQRPVPKHPYRDTALLYAALAAIVVVFAAASGGDVVKAVIVASIVFVGATAYSWWYWYDRIKNKQRGDIDRRARK